IEHPVVPAGQKARIATPVLVGEVTEGAGHRLLNDHLAQLAHDQEGNEAANGIAEDHRRTGALHDPRRAQEQAGANGSAQGDQLDMTVLQPAGERPGLQRIVTHEKSLWGNPEAPHLRTNAGGIVVKRRALYTRKRGRKPPPLGSDILTHPPPARTETALPARPHPARPWPIPPRAIQP